MISIIIIVAILFYTAVLVFELKELLVGSPVDIEDLTGFINMGFGLVIGIEFIKMLCKPNPDNVIEVLLFLVARHMIIDENTALDILLSVLSIAILFIVRQAFHIVHERKSQLVNKVAQKIHGQRDRIPPHGGCHRGHRHVAVAAGPRGSGGLSQRAALPPCLQGLM